MLTGHRVGYVRVSTEDQNTSRQLDGIELDRVFTDKLSGKNTNRPALQEAIRYLREGDTLYVHSMDRLARNVEDLRRTVRELTEKKVEVIFIKENMKFSGESNAMGNLLLSMLGAVAEFERALILERQREGIAIAKKNGVYKGRVKTLKPDQAESLRRLAEAGIPKAKLARDYNISRQTLYKYLDEDYAIE